MTNTDRKLVLIVDDVPTNLSVATGALKDLFRTKVATNGEKAFKIASGAERPDLILLDVMMPDMDGYEVCRRLKANPETAGIPIVFITAKTSEDDRENGLEAGAVDYIHKPFQAPVLVELARAEVTLDPAPFAIGVEASDRAALGTLAILHGHAERAAICRAFVTADDLRAWPKFDAVICMSVAHHILRVHVLEAA